MRTNHPLNLIRIFLGLIIAALAAFAPPAAGKQDLPPDLERGGQLYTAWDLVLNQPPIQEQNPLWPRDTSFQVPARVTWRCVSCHGWDYRASEGATLGGQLKAEGYPGLLSATSDPIEEILPWLDGTHNPDHDFSIYLSTQDLQDLSLFLSNGLTSPDLIASPETKEVQGTLSVGSQMYREYCQSCHGAEGEKINFGSTTTPAFFGDLSWANPWRVAHFIRYGHISASMPPASKVELSFSQQIDLLAYLQTLPRARAIADPEIQQVDFSTQASTTPMVYGAIAISLLIFATVAITTQRRKQS